MYEEMMYILHSVLLICGRCSIVALELRNVVTLGKGVESKRCLINEVDRDFVEAAVL